MGATSPYILDRRESTTPGADATFPFDRIEENRLFEERTTAGNMKVGSKTLTTWMSEIDAPASVDAQAHLFDTKTAAAAAEIVADTIAIYTAGYTTTGDGGNGLYKRLAAHPYTLWASGDFTPGSERRNSAGNLYRLTTRPVGTAGTLVNSVEPTHLSGAVTGGDGFGWTFITISPRYLRSADRYTLSGATDATNGGYWGLVLESGVVRLEQLGGKADWNGTTGTDNYTPLMSAINWITFDPHANTASEYSPVIELDFGKYKVGQQLSITNSIYLRGKAGHAPGNGLGGASQLHFTHTSGSWFVIHANNTGNGGENGGSWGAGQNTGNGGISRFEGFTVHNASGTTTLDLTRHAFNIRGGITCDKVVVHSSPGHAFYIHANAGSGGEHEGNCNGWELISCAAHECRGHSLYILGVDCNGGTSWKFTTHGTVGIGGCGIYDGASLGNTHIQPQITGYGNLGVAYDDGVNGYRQYQYIGGDSTTTPGTNNLIWYYLRDGGITASFPEWDVGEDYSLLTIPIFIGSNATRVVGPYVEGGNVISHSSGIVDGGIAPWTRYTPGPNVSSSVANSAITCGTGFGSFVTFQGQTGAEFEQSGDSTWVALGGSEGGFSGTAGGMKFITHRRATDGDSSHIWGYYGLDIAYINQSGRKYWRQTTSQTDEEFGRGAPQPGYLALNAFGLGGEANSDDARIMGFYNGKPTGLHANGEVWFQTNPFGHALAAYVCTVTGTPGTYGSIPLFGLSSADPVNIGDLVVESTSDTRMKFKYKGSDSTQRLIDLGLSTGGEVTAKPATAPAAGGTLFFGTGSTSGLGVYAGSGAPTISAAKGSLYLRTDGSGTSDRMYVNTDAGTTWTAVTTVA
jgi:hypothetical protein